ncbi:helix-turn-helix domain-containing protein [Vibrio maritimus]|uniref:helix-turn-helix domain-containing protein n=1 Tax=Vibrio maritimus TaxID=990268 RepID=UPI004069813C
MTLAPQWELHFSRDNFAQALKHWRSFNGMSQLDLVEALSLSHRAFQGVNQPMLSKWEHGNGQPSLMRRVGVAAFFQQPYQYSDEELRLIQSVEKYDQLFVGFDTLYPCTIDQYVTYTWDKLPELYREQILYAQEHYRYISFDDLISVMSVSEIHVVVALHKNAMVGHVVYGKDQTGQDCLLSYLALDKSLYRQVHLHVCELFEGKKMLLTAIKPYAKTVITDIYIPEKYNIGELSVFECNIDTLTSNPFFEQLHDEGRVLSLLSHHQKVQRDRRLCAAEGHTEQSATPA